MRVLFDTSRLSKGGGLQVALGHIANSLETPGIETHLVVNQPVYNQLTKDQIQKAKSCTLLKKSTLTDPGYTRQLSHAEKQIHPDLVFTVFGPTPWKPRSNHLVGYAVPKLIYPEYVAPADPSPVKRIKNSIITKLRRHFTYNADYYVVETETVRKRLDKVMGIDPSRVYVVRNSYSPMFSETIKNAPTSRRSDLYNILIPSSYYPHKNLEITPQVAFELKKLIGTGVKFTMTLPPTEREWQGIKAEADRLGVGDMIHTVGKVDHHKFALLYLDAHAVFLPTRLECSTAVYPESMITKVPLVTSDVDFAREVCKDAALYADPLDAAALAKALHQALTDEKTRDQIISNTSRVLSESYPTPEQKWQDQVDVFKDVIKRGKPKH